MRSVLIIGGGVAGIAAACALAEAGLSVELIEKRPLLGGRASSFLDAGTGDLLDECQHGTMRCCTNLADLLDRLGVHDQIRYFEDLHFLDSEGRRSTICGSGLPAPLHTGLSFLRFRSLGIADKIGIGRAMLAMLRAAPAPKYDGITIADWFRNLGQTERSIARFWRPILVSACNEELDRISCTHAFKIFRDGFLAHPLAYQFGVPRKPLGDLYTEPTRDYLARRGGRVRLRSIVASLDFADGDATALQGVTLNDGERRTADCYLCALQHDLLLKLLPEPVVRGADYWSGLQAIEMSPIMGIHLWYDRPIDCPPALAVLDRPTEWIFNKSGEWQRASRAAAERIAGSVGEPRSRAAKQGPLPAAYLSLVISASRRYAGMAQEEITALAVRDVEACLPQTKEAQLVRSRVIRWPKATISPKPGVDALRPDQRSPIPNLYVAGEWTDTGWPSTMEGAARSGYLAAERLLQDAGAPRSLLAPDLKPSWLVKLLGKGF